MHLACQLPDADWDAFWGSFMPAADVGAASQEGSQMLQLPAAIHDASPYLHSL